MRQSLAAALILASIAATPAIAQVAAAPAVLPDGAILEVVATGKTTRVPDIATIRAGVVTQATTASAALGENAQRMAGVMQALKAAGVQARDIATANVSLQPQYRYQDNQPPVLTGYQASNTVSVRFRDVAKAGGILDALVKQGANQIQGPDLSLDQPDAALDEARVDAVKRARARADLYARAAGLNVVRIVAIDENGENAGSPPPRPVFYARVQAVPQPDTALAPGETDVTATVTVRFLLK
ncbi:MAG: SIMPL domain-containing protein [Sphingomonas sp.]|uniref:SIMPL domain-containing protein n=1 Tax=Sphingomonas sp. TaxID=28214 RepID=UPI001ACAF3DD|nr:SIMPL domain-containing protein [Sphingomonas sp.]MBN8809621.1 SIMPL domain-containing protein [Sphingomonas sp.]